MRRDGWQRREQPAELPLNQPDGPRVFRNLRVRGQQHHALVRSGVCRSGFYAAAGVHRQPGIDPVRIQALADLWARRAGRDSRALADVRAVRNLLPQRFEVGAKAAWVRQSAVRARLSCALVCPARFICPARFVCSARSSALHAPRVPMFRIALFDFWHFLDIFSQNIENVTKRSNIVADVYPPSGSRIVRRTARDARATLSAAACEWRRRVGSFRR